MTISVESYFAARPSDRKKEPRYLAAINKDSCTSCTACASVCPVDCIYEVPSEIPSESYHAIDTTRCIGCQLCYRVPSESSERFTLEVCPWNAIDLLHNPNLADGQFVLPPYYRGTDTDRPWPKIEEYAYQLLLDGEARIPPDMPDLADALAVLTREEWWLGDDRRCAIAAEPFADRNSICFQATSDGLAVLTAAFNNYEKLFLD